MCGLAGVFGSDVEEEHLEAFRSIASLSYLRGEHSTGFADYSEELNPSRRYTEITIKKTIEPSNDFYSPRGTWDSAVRWDKYYTKKHVFLPPKVCMSHSRFATIGTVKKENAHPFVAGNIVGMHNGTIRSDFEGRDKFETDSEAVFNLINDKGAKEALKIIANLGSTAFALTWIDKRHKTLNILRNKERPLYFVRPFNKDVCFYASDRIFLSAVLPYFQIQAQPEIVPVDTWYTFDLTDNKNIYGSKTQEVVRPEGFFRGHTVETTTTYSSGTTSKTGTGIKPFIPKVKYADFSPFKVQHTTVAKTSFDPEINVTRVSYEQMHIVAENLEVSDVTYKKLMETGCRGCGDVCSKFSDVYFLQDKTTYLCPMCSFDDQKVEFSFLEVNEELAEKHQAAQNAKLNDELPIEMLEVQSTAVH